MVYYYILLKLIDSTDLNPSFSQQKISAQRIATYNIYYDILGNISMVIRIDQPRNLNTLQSQSQGIILGILAAIFILFFIFVFLLLELIVIIRLFILIIDVSKIDKNENSKKK
jgi:hypothetical protein